jgi:hypothetical protein
MGVYHSVHDVESKVAKFAYKRVSEVYRIPSLATASKQ